MAILIKGVGFSKQQPTWNDIKESFGSWEDIANLDNWGTVCMYPEIPNTFGLNEPYVITVLTEEVSWNTIRKEFDSWGDVKTSNTNWKSVMNYK